MKVQFVAGFGPIVRDLQESARFYRDALGLPLPEGDYDAVISEPIDDPASPRTISTTVSFHVGADKGRGRGVRH